MYKLLIKNADGVFETADFGKDTPYFTWAVNDVAATEDVQANYSQRLALPFTPTNNRLMGYLNAPQSGANNAYEYAACRLYCDGMQLIGDGGVLYLLGVTADSYEVQVLSGVADLFAELEKVNFESGFAELGEPIMPTNSQVTPARGLPELNAETNRGNNWVWAEHTIGFSNTSNTWNTNGLLEHLYPIVWLSSGDNMQGLLPALFSKIGWTFEFGEMDSDIFDMYAWSVKEPLKPTTWSNPNEVNVVRSVGEWVKYTTDRDEPIAVTCVCQPFDFDGIEAVAVNVYCDSLPTYELDCSCEDAEIGYMQWENSQRYSIGLQLYGGAMNDNLNAFYCGFWRPKKGKDYERMLIFRADGKVYQTSLLGAEYGDNMTTRLRYLDEVGLAATNRLLEGYDLTLGDFEEAIRTDLKYKGYEADVIDKMVEDLQKPTLKLIADYDTGNSVFEKNESGNVVLSLQATARPTNTRTLQTRQLIFNDAESDTAVCGAPISLARSLGFSTGVDVFKAVLQYYGLICECDNSQKVVTFHRFDELYDKKGRAVDWSDKMVEGSATRTYAIDGYAQRNVISLKENKALEWSAGVTLECPVAVIDKEQDLFNIGLQGGRGHDIAFYKIDDNGKVKSQKLNAPQVEIISDNGAPSTTWLIRGADVANYEADLRYNYAGLRSMLQRPLTIVATFSLSTLDVVSLDFFRPIYLRQFGRYFYLNEVSNWHKGAVTECTLIAL